MENGWKTTGKQLENWWENSRKMVGKQPGNNEKIAGKQQQKWRENNEKMAEKQ